MTEENVPGSKYVNVLADIYNMMKKVSEEITFLYRGHNVEVAK
jgi:hypothetical protein